MFRVALTDLQRGGSLRIEHQIPEDDPLWVGTDLALGGAVHVEVALTRTASGQLLASGEVGAPLVHECRRCLKRVDRSLHQPLELFWSETDQLSDDPAAEPEVRALEPSAVEVELGEAIREELVLAVPKYVLCNDGCRGLCPRCGTNLNDDHCSCVTDEQDPRWDALRALNNL